MSSEEFDKLEYFFEDPSLFDVLAPQIPEHWLETTHWDVVKEENHLDIESRGFDDFAGKKSNAKTLGYLFSKDYGYAVFGNLDSGEKDFVHFTSCQNMNVSEHAFSFLLVRENTGGPMYQTIYNHQHVILQNDDPYFTVGTDEDGWQHPHLLDSIYFGILSYSGFVWENLLFPPNRYLLLVKLANNYENPQVASACQTVYETFSN